MRSYLQESNEAGTIMMTISWLAGAAGAVGALSPTTRGKGFRRTTPISLVSGGTYDIFFADKSYDLLAYNVNTVGPLSATTGKRADLISDALTGTTPQVRLTFTRLDTGAEAAPAQNDQVYATFWVKRRSPL
jgi:hypothetical protein